MCMYTPVRDAKIMAHDMAERGLSEQEMIDAQPVFDSVPDDDSERVWKAIVAASRR